jgi:hypothetical protein
VRRERFYLFAEEGEAPDGSKNIRPKPIMKAAAVGCVPLPRFSFAAGNTAYAPD